MTKGKGRTTQIMERPNFSSAGSGDSVRSVLQMVQNGEEARRIFMAIVECATNTPGVEASAIFLPSEHSNNQVDMVASFGDYKIEPTQEDQKDRSGRVALQSAATTHHRTKSGDYVYFDIVCLGAPLGSLAVVAPDKLENEANAKLSELAHHAGVVYERQRLSNTLQHFLDRLEVLNELNQLIASNVGLNRIVKSLARESAFRFAADVALAFLLDEEKAELLVKGGYGCTPNQVPPEISIQEGTLGQVMRVGGHISISNLGKHTDHGLEFLEELKIKSIDACCLEVRGEALGAIIIGYRRETHISQDDLTRFEEFCQGAAVAIANARTQERITAYTERLEELVESRTADLAVQTARAEEANRAKSRFLANMSHELRTPLTAIVGYSSVMVDGIFGELNEKQSDALNSIAKSSDHLKRLIDEVLNLARIESGKEVAEPAAVPINELLVQSHKLMLQTAIGKGVGLEPLKLSDEIAETNLFADPKHIRQIIINLMSNAVKYTPQGGKVWLDVEKVSDMIKISINDTGVGIPPHKLEKLFDRFERGEDAYSKNQEGTGIGLNLTRRLVELNGGRIGVESTAGEGSTFWIMMPLAQAQTSEVSEEDSGSVNVRLDGLTTVVVDDNQDTCEVLTHILKAAGASVRVANTVRDGIELLNDEIPDIVLTDLAIPGESGLVLIEHIRNADGALSSVPVIVLSACAFKSDQLAALESGAQLFIPKPFRPQEIITNVRQLTLTQALKG